MASASTTRWVSTAPYVTLSAFIENETDTEANIRWELTYTSDSPADTSVNKAYVIEVNNSTEKSGTYDIDGKTGTKTIASGDYTVTKTHSKQSYSFRVEFAFNMKWSGVSADTLTASLTLTVPAKTSYTIKYNANGGSGAPTSQTKWHGETLTLSSTKPTRTGYKFKGWSKSASGSVKYSPGGSFDENASVTLYAVWDAVAYTITYNGNGGTGVPASQTKYHGITLVLSSTKPTRSNHAFLGWSASASATAATYKAGGNYTENKSATLYAIWGLTYVKPRITNVSAYRCNNDTDRTSNDRATYVNVSFSWKCDVENPTVTVELIGSEGTRTTSDTRIGFSGTFSLLMSNVDLNGTHTVRITVADSEASTSVSRTLSGTGYVVDLLAGGKGVSFGKPAEREGYAGFGYEILLDNNLRIAGANLAGEPVEAFQPQNSDGNTVIGWGNYKISSDLTSEERLAKTNGNTNVYGHDVHFGVANIPTPGTYRPYRRRGDILTFTAFRSAGYVTNAGKDVTFLVPLAVPIIGSPSVTVTSLEGFILRQDVAYTHGSSSSVKVHPDSYDASVSTYCGIYITAKFTDVTNVVNNAPIGIWWSGQITFS